MEIIYYTINPGGNITAIVTNNIQKKYRVTIAQQILQSDKYIEQVGFIVIPKNKKNDGRIEMAGGEFCGNAVRSLAYLLWNKKNKKKLLLESSGYNKKIPATSDSEKSTISVNINDFSLKKIEEGTIVSLPGITHLVTTQKMNKIKTKKLLKKYKLLTEKASGVISFTKKAKNIEIKPIIWVRDVGTLYEETACSSGTLAVTYLLLEDKKTNELIVKQPSGSFFKVLLKNKDLVLEGPNVSIEQYKMYLNLSSLYQY